jgi:hypothetical protein
MIVQGFEDREEFVDAIDGPGDPLGLHRFLDADLQIFPRPKDERRISMGDGECQGQNPNDPNEVIPFHSNSNLTTFAVLLNMVQADGE